MLRLLSSLFGKKRLYAFGLLAALSGQTVGAEQKTRISLQEYTKMASASAKANARYVFSTVTTFNTKAREFEAYLRTVQKQEQEFMKKYLAYLENEYEPYRARKEKPPVQVSKRIKAYAGQHREFYEGVNKETVAFAKLCKDTLEGNFKTRLARMAAELRVSANNSQFKHTSDYFGYDFDQAKEEMWAYQQSINGIRADCYSLAREADERAELNDILDKGRKGGFLGVKDSLSDHFQRTLAELLRSIKEFNSRLPR